jgi:hypothetical protein
MRQNTQIALRLKNSEDGFALVAAIMACLILLALGMLVISLSTQDIRVSAKIVGEKRSLAATEEGIHSLSQTFDPQNPVNAPVTTTRADGVSNYTINYPATVPARGPSAIPLTGYSIAGGDAWGQLLYNISVTGRSTEYNTQVTIGVGVGYGPVDITTRYH